MAKARRTQYASAAISLISCGFGDSGSTENLYYSINYLKRISFGARQHRINAVPSPMHDVTCHLTSTMSYDLFLYKSQIGKPDIDEATKIIDDDEDIWTKKLHNFETKIAIERALLEVDSSLIGFDFQNLAHKQGKTVDEVKQTFMKFELTSEFDSGIQLYIYDYHVFITVPFIHQEEEAKRAFEKLQTYIETIRKTAGYFLYDPQTSEVFDPSERHFDGLENYLSVSKYFEEVTQSVKAIETKRPWWKIW